MGATFDAAGIGSDAMDGMDAGQALNPDEVWIQYLCQTGEGEHDPNGQPDAKVRPEHAALHGTVWRMDDPSAPIPPTSWGCRCAIRYVAAPGSTAAKALPAAPSKPVEAPAQVFRDYLDKSNPDWRQVAKAMESAPAGEELAAGYAKAKDLGWSSPRERVRMVAQAKPGTFDDGAQPAKPVSPAPAAPAAAPAPAGPLPPSRLASQVSKEGAPPLKATAKTYSDGAPPLEAPNATVAAVERQIVGRTVERIAVVDNDGNILAQNEGTDRDPYGVDLKVDKALVRDGIATHNHPRGNDYTEDDPRRWGNSFSPADILFAAHYDLAEIRAVTIAGVQFSMKRPVGGWALNGDALAKLMKDIESAIGAQMLDAITSGLVTMKAAESMHFHTIMSVLAQRIGATYAMGRMP